MNHTVRVGVEHIVDFGNISNVSWIHIVVANKIQCWFFKTGESC
jgi:hypothetical protein